MRIESSSKKSTRSHSSKFDRERNPVVSILEEMEVVMRKVDLAVIEDRTADLYAAYTKVKLTGEQRTRLWKKERVPIGLNLSTCVMCGHASTNYPIENDSMFKSNTEALAKFKKDTKLWDKYICKKGRATLQLSNPHI